ncbi:MAG: hypothetical protein HHJ12_09550 [Glaciimonas sp.]|nr:hypothetical protein [Glaciimonas sp.]
MLPIWRSKFELKPGTWVFVPTEQSIKDGKVIKLAINKFWKPPKNYFHLRAGGHIKALESHLNSSNFVHLDIQNFFGSINKTRVTRCLKGLFSYADARAMANISTVINPGEKNLILPFGFVQSPILASLCLSKSALGRCIHELPKKYPDLLVSVYVDDIILSANDEANLQKAMLEVKQCAKRSGFDLNATKEEGPAPKITAFNIELTKLSLEIEPARYAEFISAFAESVNLFQREGIRSYINSVNPGQAVKLMPV